DPEFYPFDFTGAKILSISFHVERNSVQFYPKLVARVTHEMNRTNPLADRASQQDHDTWPAQKGQATVRRLSLTLHLNQVRFAMILRPLDCRSGKGIPLPSRIVDHDRISSIYPACPAAAPRAQASAFSNLRSPRHLHFFPSADRGGQRFGRLDNYPPNRRFAWQRGSP